MLDTLKGAVAAVALFAAAPALQAATVDLGDVSAGDLVGGSLIFGGTGTTVDDTWQFTLTADLLTAISVDSNELDPAFGIDDFAVTSPDIMFDFDADDDSYSFTGLLTAGTYTFDVTGITDGDFGGQYEVLVGAVPVPAALYMFGGAIFALFTTSRRRS